MSYMDDLYKDLAAYLYLPEGSVITGLDQECYYIEGCPTCGGEYDFSVSVEYVDKKGKKSWKDVDGRLTDFLSNLPLSF